jgi:hypothetical protein
LVFHGLVERDFDHRKHGCLLYVRFRDDVFLITERASKAKHAIADLKHRASACWKIEVDRVSLVAAPMLDIWFYKGSDFARTGVLRHTAFVKPTARHIPLSSRSLHPWSVHQGWPITEVQRLHGLNSDLTGSRICRSRFIDKLKRFYIDESIITRASEWKPKLNSEPKVKEKSVALRIVVGFHPCLRGLNAKLNAVVNEWRHVVTRVWGLGKAKPLLRSQVAFASGATPLHIVLRRGQF